MFSQKEAYNWYFGENAGITFNTPDLRPIALTNGALVTDEGCATISDKDGRLLFYTDGVTVWNRNHVPMPNGTGLMGHRSSTQSAIIIPKPKNNNIYYIFTTDFEHGVNGCRFSEVDMTLADGYGDVISKNNPLFYFSTEKLTAVKHANNQDWWVINHDWDSDVFRAYFVSASGVNANPIFSITGTSHSGNIKNKTGYLKASRNGTKLAMVLPASGIIELFDFNNETGTVEFPVRLSSSVFNDAYGVEFSPDGTKLYVSKQEVPSALLQFDVTSWNPSGIINTQTLIAESKDYGAFQALQIAPDNKIYVALLNKPYLGRIDFPNLTGRNCAYVDSAVSLKGKLAKQGLPNFNSTDAINFHLSGDTVVCEGETVYLSSVSVFNATYQWSGPNGFISNIQNPVIPSPTLASRGYYRLKLTVSGIEYTDSIFVDVLPMPKVTIEVKGKMPFCEGDTVRLTASTTEQGLKYAWSTGETTNSISISKGGSYRLVVTNQSGCTKTIDTIIPSVNLSTRIVPNSSHEFCSGDSVVLTAAPLPPGVSFVWSTGETTKSITVKQTRKIILTAVSPEGCVKRDTLQVNEYDKLKTETVFDKTGSLCEGDTLILSTNYSGEDFIYMWSTGEKTPSIVITQSFSGWVFVNLKSGCGDTAFIEIPMNPKPNIFISTDKAPVICSNDEIQLSALTNNILGQMNYLWSTGETTRDITVSDSGLYTVRITTDSGCTSTGAIYVKVIDAPELEIISSGPTNLCDGDELELTAAINQPDSEIIWSTGSTDRTIQVNQSGYFYVKATNQAGCSDSVGINVKFNKTPDVELISSGPTKLCRGNSIVLSTADKYQIYRWSTGDSSEFIRVSEPGQYWVSITDSNGCTAISNIITVDVTDVDLNIANFSDTRFGNICIDSSATRRIRLRNNTAEPITIESILLKNYSEFDIAPERSLPAVLTSGSVMNFDLTFAPEEFGLFSDTIKVLVTSPCFYEFEFITNGNGTARGILKADEIIAPIGTHVCIPVYLSLICGKNINQTIEFNGSLSFDYTMFLPDADLHPFVIGSSLQGSRRILDISGEIDALDSSRQFLFEICGTVLYGNFEWTTIELSDFAWSNPFFSSISLSGELATYGMCEFDLSRIRFIPTTSMNILQAGFSDELLLQIRTEESGSFMIEMYNAAGVRVYHHSFASTGETIRQLEHKPAAEGLPSGFYSVVLRTPSAVSSYPVIIYK